MKRCATRLAILAAVLALSPAPHAWAGELGLIPQWIWSEPFPRQVSGPGPRANDIAYFRKECSAPLCPNAKKIELRGLVDGRMTVYWSGREVARFSGTSRYEAVDITRAATPLVRAGATLSVRVECSGSSPGFLLRLDGDGVPQLVTDGSWSVSTSQEAGWENVFPPAGKWQRAASLGQLGVAPWGEPKGEQGDYYQWMLAKGPAGVASNVTAPAGFKVELVRSSQPGEGSWVSLASDPKGRLFIGREGPGILRYTLASEGKPDRMEVVNDKLLECRGLLWAYDSLYANANNSKGLYRLRDLDNDDAFEDVQLLKATPGGVGHGRNDLALGPDGYLYVIHGNDVRLPEKYEEFDSPLRNQQNDRLLPCSWDPYMFDSKATLPAGYVARTDRDGKIWEVIAGGFRNPYGIDFNEDGEMFTFDADNEGDLGAPWYRSTRVNHIVSGGDYGWRQGTANRPAYYAEHIAPNLDIGKSSPTSVKFGTKSNFGEVYQRALFILDWSYGRILAVHLTPDGASYQCTAETFVEGRPLNVTDLEFAADGSMYFVTGGRGTQSALYRVSIDPSRPSPPKEARPLTESEQRAKEARAIRKRLEEQHRRPGTHTMDEAHRHMDSDDPWLRYAARVAMERGGDWTLPISKRTPLAEAQAALIQARIGGPWLFSTLERIEWEKAPLDARLTILRAYAVGLVRMGKPKSSESVDRIRARLEKLYPAEHVPLNRLLAELLVALDSPLVAAKTMPLLTAATTQEDKLYWLYILRNVRQGWTPESRAEYFKALAAAGKFDGGRDMPTAVFSIRVEALAAVPAGDRPRLAALLADEPAAGGPADPIAPPRPLVKAWELAELTGVLEKGNAGRDFERGRALFSTAMCNRCHRFAGAGAPIGPDLSAVSHRFGRKDLLETILVPSKVIDEKYRDVMLETSTGKVLVGRIVSGDDHTVLLSTNPVSFDQLERVAKSDIESQTPSRVSPMPAGLLNTLTPEEILDLLAYLESGGDKGHPVFRK